MNLRKLLLPFSWLYGMIISLRNVFYDAGIFSSKKFDVPVICIGNLTTGGTGKTPHIEYLLRILKNNFIIATLSRGYGRNTKGFIVAKPGMTTEILGDEPLQYSLKFPEVIISVGENRARAIEKLLSAFPGIEIILMDDGFQHRAVKPGFSILLTEYSNLFTKDHLLPAGNLRENKSGFKRANVLVVTKCPELNETEKQKIINEIAPLPLQHVLFSHFCYDELIPFSSTNAKINLSQFKEFQVLLLTGIANPESIIEFMNANVAHLHQVNFPDHHSFSKNDIEALKKKFNNIVADKKIIITTEKDFMRLKKESLKELILDLPFYYLPVKVDFALNDKKILDEKILNYVRKN